MQQRSPGIQRRLSLGTIVSSNSSENFFQIHRARRGEIPREDGNNRQRACTFKDAGTFNRWLKLVDPSQAADRSTAGLDPREHRELLYRAAQRLFVAPLGRCILGKAVIHRESCGHYRHFPRYHLVRNRLIKWRDVLRKNRPIALSDKIDER